MVAGPSLTAAAHVAQGRRQNIRRKQAIQTANQQWSVCRQENLSTFGPLGSRNVRASVPRRIRLALCRAFIHGLTERDLGKVPSAINDLADRVGARRTRPSSTSETAGDRRGGKEKKRERERESNGERAETTNKGRRNNRNRENNER